MKFLSHASLRQMLTVPYIALVLVAASSIGFLSYDAGSSAVDTLSDLVLSETVGRISQAVDKHVSGSEAVLDTAFPPDIPAPKNIVTDLDTLRQRFWLATTVHLDPNNYAYYGNRSGQFIGLWRFSKTEAELRLRTESEGPRSIYQYSTIRGELKSPVPETRIFDPRDRPWYKAGQGVKTQTWTSIYIDFKTLNLVGTRARRVQHQRRRGARADRDSPAAENHRVEQCIIGDQLHIEAARGGIETGRGKGPQEAAGPHEQRRRRRACGLRNCHSAIAAGAAQRQLNLTAGAGEARFAAIVRGHVGPVAADRLGNAVIRGGDSGGGRRHGLR